MLKEPAIPANAKCKISGCLKPLRYPGMGWCQMHYFRHMRTGRLGIAEHRMPQIHSGYRRSHQLVAELWGKASRYACVTCGDHAGEWAYDGTDPSEKKEEMKVSGRLYPIRFSVWQEFYMPLCTGCHRAKDAGARSKRRTHCKQGHLMDERNTYTRPSRPTTRECRKCKDLEYVRRRAARCLP